MAPVKSLVVVSLVAVFTTLVVACKNDAESSCDKINDLCGAINDCEAVGKSYSDARDKATDAQKDAADKFYDCIDDADTCDAAKKCSASTSGTNTTGGADAGSDSARD